MSGDRLNKVMIELKHDRCLHTRSTWTSCSLCVSSCPEGAIRVAAKNKAPSVDLTLCIQCGQCLSACPLETFESSDFSERQLLSRIKPEENVRLHCFIHQKECAQLSSGLNTYQLSTCLAALTPGALFELSYSRVCELSTDKCRSCHLFARVKQTLECNEMLASQLLSDWGKSGNLRETEPLFLQESHDDGSSESVLGLASEATSEDEDIFEATRVNIRSLFHGTRKNEDPSKKMLPLKAKERRVPSWRMRLKAYWSRRSDSEAERCPWPVLVVDDDRCKACGICLQLCPTGSICHSFDNNVYSITYVPGSCVNCGLCIISCAESALSRDYQVVKNPFDELACSNRTATPCTRCSLPILEGRGERLCHICESEPDPLVFMERLKAQLKTISERKAGKNDGSCT